MLQALTEVQALDLKIDALREERGNVPPELIATFEKRRDLQARIKRKQQEQDELRRRVNANEMELKSMAERRRSAADAALRASTVKEASQYQNQELQFGTRVQELEEDTLPLMESFETVSGEVDELQSELDALEPELEAMQQTEQDRVTGVDERIAATSSEREALASGIDASLLKQYEQIRKARRGVGIVEIVDNARCGGCSVRLPIHVVQKARRGDGVTRCPSCGRILWSKG